MHQYNLERFLASLTTTQNRLRTIQPEADRTLHYKRHLCFKHQKTGYLRLARPCGVSSSRFGPAGTILVGLMVSCEP